jgi:hypothetical protein
VKLKNEDIGAGSLYLRLIPGRLAKPAGHLAIPSGASGDDSWLLGSDLGLLHRGSGVTDGGRL